MHTREPDEALVVVPFELPQEPQFQSGGGGLYSTAPDYLRFTQMLLQRGTFNGTQVLQPETVHTMAQNHIGDLNCGELWSIAPALDRTANFFPGMPQKWGLSFLINTAQTPQGRAPGSLAWAGVANTFFWIDPTKRVTGVFITQQLPFFDPKALALFRAYEVAVSTAPDCLQHTLLRHSRLRQRLMPGVRLHRHSDPTLTLRRSALPACNAIDRKAET
jgi:CubicO group peptidase (beta-lactamase class C family)